MYKFVTFVLAVLIAGTSAKPGGVAHLAPAPLAAVPLAAAPVAYANAPLYAAGGSSQIDVRNNYDGTLSSYTTTPFHYSGPFASRYVSGIPAAYAAAAPLVAPAFPAKYAAPAALAAPLAAPAFHAKYVAPAAFAAPAPLVAAPAPAPLAAPYATAFAAPASYAW